MFVTYFYLGRETGFLGVVDYWWSSRYYMEEGIIMYREDIIIDSDRI